MPVSIDMTDELVSEPALEEIAPPPKKRGRKSWDAISMLEVHDMDPNYVYRWETNDPAALRRQRQYGWEPCSAIAGSAKRADERTVQDGQPLTSVAQYREVVLLRLPKDDALDRRAYMAAEADSQIRRVKSKAKQEHAQLANGDSRPLAMRGKLQID